jgi:uncharacterized repeat protein (TIGR01451 family)
MQSVRPLVFLACAIAFPAVADTLSHVNRSANADRRLTLRRDCERLVLVDDDTRVVVASARAATTDRVAIEGASGDRRDSLTIDLSQPITLAGGIDYDGGEGGWDVLALSGGSARRQTITQLTPHDGNIDIDGLVIRYRNLEPITDTVPAVNYTIIGTAGADGVTVTDGPGGTTTISSPSFESVTFANKTNVVFDGMGGGDHVTFDNPNPATGLVSFMATNVGTVAQTGAVRYPSLGISGTAGVGLTNASNDVDRIEITTQNGNVVYHDADDVIIGGVSPALAGVRAVQTGSVGVQSLGGSLTLADADGAEMMKAGNTSGNVTLYAAGAASDIIATVNSHAAVAPAGSGFIQAGRNIELGTGGPSFANDVRFATYGSLTAGGTTTIAGLTTVMASGLPPHLGAALQVIGSGGVTVLDGARVVAAGAGADLDILSLKGISFLGTVPAAVSESGDVFILPRELVIAPTSGVSAPAGRATIWSEAIDLGTVVDAPGAPVELSDAELDRIVAPVVVVTTTSEPLRVTAPVTFSGTELVLFTSRTVTATGSGSLTAPVLTFHITNDTPYVWTITPTTVQIAGGTPVPYSGVTTLNANASAAYLSGVSFPGVDTLFVTPSPTTTINVDGNLPTPPATPGDTLDFDLTGVVSPVLTATLTADGYQGSLTSANRQPVNFREIESLVDAPVDLGVTKTDGAATVPAGAPVTYTITVTNPAPIPVVGATVEDVFPPELIGVQWTCVASPGSTCAAAGNGNANDTVTLAANGSVTYTATGTTSPSQTGTLSNTATVTTPAGYVETNAANNSATDTTVLTAEANPIVTKSTTTEVVHAEEAVTYTITLRNAGPSDARDVVLTDAIPAGTTVLSLTAPAGYTCTTARTVTCTREVLPPSATADTFTLTLRVSPAAARSGATITNTARVTSSTTDPMPGNNAATAVVSTAVAIPTVSGMMLLLLAGLLAAMAVRAIAV